MNESNLNRCIPADVLSTAGRLSQAGYQAFLAGGCVRDLLLGRTPKDYDIATNARPDQVQSLFTNSRSVGKSFGVILVVLEDRTIEVATFRKDMNYRDGRHPESVEFSTAEEDAQRRDFTINGLFLDPASGAILDYVDGRADLVSRTIRAIGAPETRFREDYLRMLRAVRFASVLEFTLEPKTFAALQACAPMINRISVERIQQELTTTLTQAPRAGEALELLSQVGLLREILPEVEALRGVEQPPEYHPEGDVYQHTRLMLNGMSSPTAALAYAVLFHDISKPACFHKVPLPGGGERIRFDGHAEQGAILAEQIMLRLKMSRALMDEVMACVRGHMRFMDVPNMRTSTLRRLAGAPTIDTELALHRLDCLCSHGMLDTFQFLKKFVEDFRNEPVLPKPWITGRDLMALGVPEGTAIGQWKKQAYDLQLEDRFSDREALLGWLQEASRSGRPPEMEKQSKKL